jgi:hypothetical protein
MLFNEVIAVHNVKHKKGIITKCRLTVYLSRCDIDLPLGFKGSTNPYQRVLSEKPIVDQVFKKLLIMNAISYPQQSTPDLCLE